MITLVLLGNSEECALTLVSEFARIYAFPTHRYNNYDIWLEKRGKLIKVFTKYNDNYYMLANRKFHHCYSRYGFCSACGILIMDGLATISNSMSLLRNLNIVVP